MNVIKKIHPVRQAKPLRVLIVEDSQDDVLLLLHELQRGGYEPDYELVDNEQDMRRALESRHWDIVITDHRLPFLSIFCGGRWISGKNAQEDTDLVDRCLGFEFFWRDRVGYLLACGT